MVSVKTKKMVTNVSVTMVTLGNIVNIVSTTSHHSFGEQLSLSISNSLKASNRGTILLNETGTNCVIAT